MHFFIFNFFPPYCPWFILKVGMAICSKAMNFSSKSFCKMTKVINLICYLLGLLSGHQIKELLWFYFPF